MESPAKIIAASLALSAFATAILAGLASGNDPHGVILRALGCMFACLMLGHAIGAAGTTAVAEMLDRFRHEHPVPEVKPFVPNSAHPATTPGARS